VIEFLEGKVFSSIVIFCVDISPTLFNIFSQIVVRVPTNLTYFFLTVTATDLGYYFFLTATTINLGYYLFSNNSQPKLFISK
jgi:hypothetical protein